MNVPKAGMIERIRHNFYALDNDGARFRGTTNLVAQLAVCLSLTAVNIVLFRYMGIDTVFLIVLAFFSFIKYAVIFSSAQTIGREKTVDYIDDIYELQNHQLARTFLDDTVYGIFPNMKPPAPIKKPSAIAKRIADTQKSLKTAQIKLRQNSVVKNLIPMPPNKKITIDDGRVLKKDETSSIILIGGPGYVQVNLDSVALVERSDGTRFVISPRKEPWSLMPFDRIREIGREQEPGKREYATINLRDQFVVDIPVPSRSKDGIPVTASGVKALFSILRDSDITAAIVPGDSMSFDDESVEKLVYQQALILPKPTTSSGVGFPWNTTVIPLIHRELKNIITSSRLSEILANISQRELDELAGTDESIAKEHLNVTGQMYAGGAGKMPPPKFTPRSEITASFFREGFQEKAARMGIRLEWIDIGTWKLADPKMLDKYKDALDLARSNAFDKKQMEMAEKKIAAEEFIKLINLIIISVREKRTRTPYRNNGKEERDERTGLPKTQTNIVTYDSENEETYYDSNYERDPIEVAHDMLKAFRGQFLLTKGEILQDTNLSDEQKRKELENIDISIAHITPIVAHWVGQQSHET